MTATSFVESLISARSSCCFGFADDFACGQYADHGTYYKSCAADDVFKSPKPQGEYKPKKSDTYKEIITAYVLGS